MSEKDASPLPIVVVAEDDFLLRMLATDILTDQGYAVLEAESAEVALMMLESTSNVRLLFTDVQMPGALDGMELARRVCERWPLVPVLVTSGQRRIRPGDLPDSARFLAKPYRQEDLVAVIDNLIRG